MRVLRSTLGWIVIGGLAAAVPALGNPAGAVQLRDAVLQVDGMTCSGCAARLEAMLRQVDGIASVRVDLDAGRAYVTFDPATIDPEKLAEGISKEGLAARYLPDEEVPDPSGDEPPEAAAAKQATGTGLGDEEIDRVVRFLVDRLASRDHGDKREITRDEIATATGVFIPDSELGAVEARVMDAVREDPVAVARIAAAEGSDGCAIGHCGRYEACSLHGNLAGATGDLLDMYRQEKEQDGRQYVDLALADFEARDLRGNVVRSADLRGRPVLLTLLAGHCGHCHDSLPILQEAVDTWGPKGLRVVGVLVNSGSVDNVNEWLPLTDPRYEVWVHTDPALGDLLGSHLVPSYFFVNARGQVTEKLVGYKNRDVLLEKIAAFAEPSGPGEPGETASVRGDR